MGAVHSSIVVAVSHIVCADWCLQAAQSAGKAAVDDDKWLALFFPRDAMLARY